MGMIQNKTNGDSTFAGYAINKATLTFAANVVLTAADIWGLKNIFKLALTNACEIDLPTTGIQEDQEIEFWLAADGTDRTVTFDANSQDRGNCAIESNTTAIVVFVFNGTTWVEKSRSVTAAS